MDKLYTVIKDNTKNCLFLMVIHTSYDDAQNFINEMCLKYNIEPEEFKIIPIDVGTIYKIYRTPFNNKKGN
jgi:hypothetical protein